MDPGYFSAFGLFKNKQIFPFLKNSPWWRREDHAYRLSGHVQEKSDYACLSPQDWAGRGRKVKSVRLTWAAQQVLGQPLKHSESLSPQQTRRNVSMQSHHMTADKRSLKRTQSYMPFQNKDIISSILICIVFCNAQSHYTAIQSNQASLMRQMNSNLTLPDFVITHILCAHTHTHTFIFYGSFGYHDWIFSYNYVFQSLLSTLCV